ncbi:MAG: hypothetical protein KAJ19_16265, partial [Gammaproteobacteria bacterium]|nr:hypothetical protein [Gammaproteobacteria bacterium]
MKKLIALLFAIIMACTLASCKHMVTETGSPCPPGECPSVPQARPPDEGGDEAEESPVEGEPQPQGDAAEADEEEKTLRWYHDSASKLYIGYPQSWGIEEEDSSGSLHWVKITNGLPWPTRVTVQWEVLEVAPSSLLVYARNNFPDADFIVYDE